MTPFLKNPIESTEASRILIVEDEAIVAESLKDQLVNLGYQVCGTAANGEDAMRIMENSEPDLVMMDIMLEGSMDGIEVAGRIREKNEIPVIFLTAYSDNETLQRAKITEPLVTWSSPTRNANFTPTSKCLSTVTAWNNG